MTTKETIEQKVKDLLSDIRYKLQNGVPMQFIHPIQTEIFALEWVLEQMEAKECSESGGGGLQNPGSETN